MSETTKTEPIDYQRPGAHNDSVWSQILGWFVERVCGVAEFLGILIGIVGSVRQVIFAIGLAVLAGGLGKSFYHEWHGPRWMFIGALIAGLAWPTRFSERK